MENEKLEEVTRYIINVYNDGSVVVSSTSYGFLYASDTLSDELAEIFHIERIRKQNKPVNLMDNIGSTKGIENVNEKPDIILRNDLTDIEFKTIQLMSVQPPQQYILKIIQHGDCKEFEMTTQYRGDWGYTQSVIADYYDAWDKKKKLKKPVDKIRGTF